MEKARIRRTQGKYKHNGETRDGQESKEKPEVMKEWITTKMRNKKAGWVGVTEKCGKW